VVVVVVNENGEAGSRNKIKGRKRKNMMIVIMMKKKKTTIMMKGK
jgi:hypothetical protein